VGNWQNHNWNSKPLIFFLVVFLIVPFVTLHAQTKTEIILNTQSEINLDILRGVVELYPIRENKIIIEEKVFNYTEPGNTQAHRSTDGKKLKIDQTASTIFMKNSFENLQSIKIYLPAHLDVRIKINHNGEILIHNLSNIIQADIYQGKITGIVSNTLSANIVRDGKIDIICKSSREKKFIMLSGYSADISLKVHENMQASFTVSTDLGSFNEELPIDFTESKGNEFFIIDPVTKGKTIAYEKIFKGTQKNGRDFINIKNTRGKILIMVGG
jgi:hypothetical protein